MKDEANKLELVIEHLENVDAKFKLSIKDFDDVRLNAPDALSLLVAAERVLETDVPLDRDTTERVTGAFPQIDYGTQAFPKVAKCLGFSGGKKYDPHAIRWHFDGSTALLLPPQIQDLLPDGVIVSVQKCRLQINRLSNEGFFKVQERWGNDILQPEYGTKVPLNNWMNRGIDNCITVSLDNPSKGCATLIGVFDIQEGSMALIDEDLFATKAFEHVQGKSSKSLEVQFVKNLFHVMKQSPKEREAIQAIMNHCQSAVFVPARNELSKRHSDRL